MYGNKETQKRRYSSFADNSQGITGPNKKQRLGNSLTETLQKPHLPSTPNRTSLKGTDSLLKSMDSIIFAVKSGKTPSTPKAESSKSRSDVAQTSFESYSTPRRMANVPRSPRPFSGKSLRLSIDEAPKEKTPDIQKVTKMKLSTPRENTREHKKSTAVKQESKTSKDDKLPKQDLFLPKMSSTPTPEKRVPTKQNFAGKKTPFTSKSEPPKMSSLPNQRKGKQFNSHNKLSKVDDKIKEKDISESMEVAEAINAQTKVSAKIRSEPNGDELSEKKSKRIKSDIGLSKCIGVEHMDSSHSEVSVNIHSDITTDKPSEKDKCKNKPDTSLSKIKAIKHVIRSEANLSAKVEPNVASSEFPIGSNNNTAKLDITACKEIPADSEIWEDSETHTKNILTIQTTELSEKQKKCTKTKAHLKNVAGSSKYKAPKHAVITMQKKDHMNKDTTTVVKYKKTVSLLDEIQTEETKIDDKSFLETTSLVESEVKNFHTCSGSKGDGNQVFGSKDSDQINKSGDHEKWNKKSDDNDYEPDIHKISDFEILKSADPTDTKDNDLKNKSNAAEKSIKPPKKRKKSHAKKQTVDEDSNQTSLNIDFENRKSINDSLNDTKGSVNEFNSNSKGNDKTNNKYQNNQHMDARMAEKSVLGLVKQTSKSDCFENIKPPKDSSLSVFVDSKKVKEDVKSVQSNLLSKTTENKFTKLKKNPKKEKISSLIDSNLKQSSTFDNSLKDANITSRRKIKDLGLETGKAIKNVSKDHNSCNVIKENVKESTSEFTAGVPEETSGNSVHSSLKESSKHFASKHIASKDVVQDATSFRNKKQDKLVIITTGSHEIVESKVHTTGSYPNMENSESNRVISPMVDTGPDKPKEIYGDMSTDVISNAAKKKRGRPPKTKTSDKLKSKRVSSVSFFDSTNLEESDSQTASKNVGSNKERSSSVCKSGMIKNKGLDDEQDHSLAIYSTDVADKDTIDIEAQDKSKNAKKRKRGRPAKNKKPFEDFSELQGVTGLSMVGESDPSNRTLQMYDEHLPKKKDYGSRRLSLKKCSLGMVDSNANESSNPKTENNNVPHKSETKQNKNFPKSKVKSAKVTKIKTKKVGRPPKGSKKIVHKAENNTKGFTAPLNMEEICSPTVRARVHKKAVKLDIDSEEEADSGCIKENDIGHGNRDTKDTRVMCKSPLEKNLFKKRVPSDSINDMNESEGNHFSNKLFLDKSLDSEKSNFCDDLNISTVDYSEVQNYDSEDNNTVKGDVNLSVLASESETQFTTPQNCKNKGYINESVTEINLSELECQSSSTPKPLIFAHTCGGTDRLKEDTMKQLSDSITCDICESNRKGERSEVIYKNRNSYKAHLRKSHGIYQMQNKHQGPTRKKSQGGIKIIEDEGGGTDDISMKEDLEPDNQESKGNKQDRYPDSQGTKQNLYTEDQESKHDLDPDSKETEQDLGPNNPEIKQDLDLREGEGQTGRRRSRRSAATKAISKWKEAKSEIEEMKKVERELYIIKYHKPTDQLPISEEVWHEIKKIGKKSNTNFEIIVKCPYHEMGCEKEYTKLPAVRAHIKTCKCGQRKTLYNGFQCTQCDYKVKNEKKMKKHIKIHEWLDDEVSVSEGDITDQDNDPDVDFEREAKINKHFEDEDEETEYMDVDESDEDDEDASQTDEDYIGEEATKRKSSQKSNYSIPDSSIRSTYMQDAHIFLNQFREMLDSTKTGTDERLIDTPFLWTHDFMIANEKMNLFPQYRSHKDDFLLLEKTEAVKYLPSSSQSVPFSYSTNTNMQVLGLFKASDTYNGAKTAFLGGPIWAMAWCPSPVGVETNQYLAVYCHRNKDCTHFVPETEIHSTLIQVWDFGLLKNGKEANPQLAYCLCLDVGAVWDMKWCPTGCYDLDQPSVGHTGDRIGLLALATSAGYVTILSIPKPSSITSLYDTSDSPKVFKPCNIWMCKQNSYDQSASNCTCVDWSWKDDCSKIAAGFGDGSVSLWNVSSTSKLLTSFSKDRNKVALPYLTIQAHTDGLIGVRFCPKLPQYLSTASLDRDYKLWDLLSPSLPLDIVGRGRCSTLEAPVNYINCFVGYDDAFNWNTNTVMSIESSYVDREHFPAFSIKSSVWGLSFNNWANTVAMCTSGGEVIINYLHLMVHLYKIRKKHALRRLKVFTTKLQQVTGSITNEPANSTKDMSSNPETSEPDSLFNSSSFKTVKPISQEDKSCVVATDVTMDTSDEPMVKSSHDSPNTNTDTEYGVVFTDSKLKCVKDIIKCPVAKSVADMRKSEICSTGCSHAVFNRVAWNPNLGSHYWLASASNSGLLRLHCITALHTNKIDQWVQQLKKT